MAEGESDGHKSLISVIDTSELGSAYEFTLRMIDAADTLAVITRK